MQVWHLHHDGGRSRGPALQQLPAAQQQAEAQPRAAHAMQQQQAPPPAPPAPPPSPPPPPPPQHQQQHQQHQHQHQHQPRRSSSIAAAAAVPPIASARRRAAWLLAGAGVQCVWGLYSVCTRLLSTAPVPIPPLQLSAVISILCWPATAALCCAPALVRRCHHHHHRQQQQQQQPGKAAPPGDDATAAVAAATAWPPLRTRLAGARVEAIALAVGLLITAAALGLVYSTVFVPAYIVQLAMVLVPPLTALAARVLLSQPAPRLLLPFLGLGVGGSVMVVVGQWLAADAAAGAGGTAARTGAGDARQLPAHAAVLAGLAVSLASALAFAGYFVALQATRTLVPTSRQLMASRTVAVVVLVPLALGVEGLHWGWLWELRPVDWGALLFGALVAYTLATAGLQLCTRALGSVVMAMLNSLRLVSAIAGSALLLHEVPRHPLTWAGFVVVVASTSGWLWLQARHGQRQPQQAATAAAPGRDGGKGSQP